MKNKEELRSENEKEKNQLLYFLTNDWNIYIIRISYLSWTQKCIYFYCSLIGFKVTVCFVTPIWAKILRFLMVFDSNGGYRIYNNFVTNKATIEINTFLSSAKIADSNDISISIIC